MTNPIDTPIVLEWNVQLVTVRGRSIVPCHGTAHLTLYKAVLRITALALMNDHIVAQNIDLTLFTQNAEPLGHGIVQQEHLWVIHCLLLS
jgi:hypothetical protein